MPRSYREHAPGPLAPFVECYWTSEIATGTGGSHPVHPDGCIDSIFDAAAGRLEVVGTMTRTLWVEGRGSAGHAAVRFRPGGAVVFLREAAHRFTDQAVDAVSVLGPAAHELERRLVDTASVDDARRLIESFLSSRSRCAEPVDPRVAHAASRLASDPGMRVDTLSAELGITRQHARRLFLEHVGVTPKVFARNARAARALGAIDASPSLARTAIDAGYTDQAHMSRELGRVLGMPPSRYRQRSRAR